MKPQRKYYIPLALSLTLGCATTGPSIPLEGLVPAREIGHTAPGQWQYDENMLTSLVPADAPPELVRSGANGIGVSTGLIEGFSSVDLDLEATVSYEEAAAVGLLFHVELKEDVFVSAMYLAINSDGLFLWRYEDGVWQRVGVHQISIPAAQPHKIAVQVRGDSIRCYLNDVRVLSGTHSGANGTGAGVSTRAGIGHIHSLRARALD